jgi:integrase
MARSGIPLCGTGDGGMSEEEFKMPRKFTFDEFYEMLKEYVNDPKARELLAIYDAEDAEGRGELSDTSCSELAFDSYADFRGIGWAILAKHGWPTYYQIIENTKEDFELRQKLCRPYYNFVTIARRFIRREKTVWMKRMEFLPDQDFDVNDQESVTRFMKMYVEKYPRISPYTLVGEI